MKKPPPGKSLPAKSRGKGAHAPAWFRAALCLWLMCLIALACQPGLAAKRPSQKRLEIMVSDKVKGFELARDFLKGLDAELKSRVPMVRERLNWSKERYHQLMFMLHLSLNNPYESSLIFQDLSEISDGILAELRPLIKLERDLGISSTNLRESLKELDGIAELAKGSGFSGQIKEMKATGRELLSLIQVARKETAELLKPTKAFADKVARRVAGLDRDLVEQWIYLFQDDELSVFNPDLWNSFGIVSSAWFRHLPRLTAVRLPVEHWREDFEFIAWLVLGWLAVFLAGRLYLARRRPLGLSRENPAGVLIKRAWLLLTLAGALALFNSVNDFPDNYLSDVVALVLTAWGCLYLGWGVRRLHFPDLDASPATPLLWVYALNMCLFFLGCPMEIFDLLAPFILLISVWFLYRTAKKDLPALEEFLAGAGMWGVIGLCILSAYGMSYLAIYLLSAWLMMACGLQIVEGLIYQLKQGGWAKSKSTSGALLFILISPLARLLLLLAVAVWLAHQLGGLHLLVRLAQTKVEWRGLYFSLEQVFTMVLLFFVVRALVSASKEFWGRLAEWTKLERGVTVSMQVITTYGMWSLYVILVLYLLGANPTSLLVLAGGLSVGIGFGLQNIVNNFLSGLIILFGSSLHQGDVIEVDGHLCLVLKINIRTTVVQSRNNALIILPNSDVISSRLINWTRNGKKVRREMRVGVAYGSDVEKVKALLMEVAAAHPRVLENPKPRVMFWDFGNSTLDFVLRVWIDHIDYRNRALSDLREATDRAFRENGIEIAFPQMDLHVKELPPGQEEAPKA